MTIEIALMMCMYCAAQRGKAEAEHAHGNGFNQMCADLLHALLAFPPVQVQVQVQVPVQVPVSVLMKVLAHLDCPYLEQRLPVVSWGVGGICLLEAAARGAQVFPQELQ